MNGTAGVILAGGAARRFGGRPKGLEQLDGKPLLGHVVDRLTPQVDRLLISYNSDAAGVSGFGLTVVPDGPWNGRGPLGGVAACLRHIRAEMPEITSAATAPWDAPLLPVDLVERLRAAEPGRPSYAVAAGRPQPIFALWPTGLAADLGRYVESTEDASLIAALRHFGGAPVAFPDSATFANVNTPDDLDLLRRSRG